MGQPVATLEILLQMATGNSVAEISKFGGAVSGMAGAAIKDLQRIEQASGGAINVTGAVSGLRQMQDAVGATSASAVRDFNRIENAAERLNSQLERDISTYGKTAAQIRDMRVEAAALAAQSQGQTELATRLRGTSATLREMEAAAGGATKAVGFNRMQMITAQSAVMRFGDAVISGMNPLKAFALEAHKGVEVMSMDEGGFAGGLFKIAGLAGALAAPLAVAGVAFERWHKELNADNGLAAYAKQLGLTQKQIEDAGGATVTMGDMVKGVWKTIVDDIKSALGGPGVKRLVDYLFSPNDAKQVEGLLASIYGTFVGAYEATVATWRQFPAAFADLIIQGINKGAEGIEWLVNKAIDGANLLGQNLSHVDLGRLKNNFAGAAHDVGTTFQSEVQKATAAAQKGIDNFIATSGRNALQQARDRLKDKASDPKEDKHAEQLAREAAAEEAQIKNLYKLADAYTVSGAAALIAEAREKAESKAIKARGDLEAEVSRQVRLAIAQRVADAEKSAASTNAQAAAQEAVNAAVAAGLVPAAQAAEALRDRIALLPILDAYQGAIQTGDEKGAAASVKAIGEVTEAQERSNAARREAQLLASMDSTKDEFERLQQEARLIGVDTAARAHQIGVLKAWQEAQRMNLPIDDALAYVAVQARIVDLSEANTQATSQLNEHLRVTAELASSVGESLSESFGKGGAAIGKMIEALGTYGARQEEIAKQVRAGQMSAAAGATLSANVQIGTYADITDAAKGMFNEHSKIYKALQAAEEVFRAVQLAMSIAAMFQSSAETAVKVANAGVQATAEGSAGVAKQSQLPFPANIAAMAATAAALVAAGVMILGGHGGGHNTLAPANTGTGTVLGDPSAKSDSIKNAIDVLKDVNDATLSVSRDMLISLRAIETNIGGLASLLVRSGNIDASSGIAQGFKTNAIGSVLSNIPLIGGLLSSLFGTKTTVIGSGLYGAPQAVGDILSGGYDLQTYSDIEKKKKFLGITTSTKYSTQYGQADQSIDDQFTLVLRSFYQAIAKAAPELGQATNDVEQRLNSFVFSIGKIDIQGKTGTEIQDLLENVLGAAADNMAQAAVPGLDKFQKVGEGYFQTLVRVATTVEQVDATFEKLGVTASSMGIDVDMAIANMFDNVSDFTSLADTYLSDYYSKAEQAAAQTSQIAKAFSSLGLAMPDTLAGFRQLVEAQDLTTDAGRQIYVTLLQLAPAFSDLKTSLEGAKSAADILSEQQDLQNQLWQLQGNTIAIRQAELAKLDPSNRALQQQIYAIQDAQDAAKAADDLRQAWQSVGDSIMTEVQRIRGLTDASSGGSFASILGQFNAATANARAGDQDAAKLLPGLSQSLLAAAQAQATSRQELDRIQAQTAASLEATYGVITALTSAASSSTSLDTAAASAQGASSPSAANDDTASEIAGLRADMADMSAKLTAALATIAGNTGRTAKKLDDVTGQSGGDAIAIVQAAA